MKRLPILFCFAAILAACGGGQGGAPATPVAAAAPVIAAMMVTDLEDAATMGQLDDEPAMEPQPEGMQAGAAPMGSTSAADFTIAGYGPGRYGMQAVGDAPSIDALATPGRGTHVLYVSPNGADRNPGTLAQPFRSIARAAKAARAGSKVLVAPGTYEGGFRTTASGLANARILFLSTSKWGAKITPPSNSPNKTAWDNRGSYVDIVGFEVDGSNYLGGRKWSNGIYSGGSHGSIRNNHVHHIAQTILCTRAGGAAIGIDSYYRGVNAEVIANLVHDIGPADCRFVQGIYVSTSGRIKNNMVYRVNGAGIHLWHDARNVIITNNTVTASTTGIIIGGGNYYHSSGPNDHTAVYSNIVYDNKLGISEQGRTGRNNTYRNNLVYHNSTYDWRLRNGLTHTGTVSSPPLFIDNARAANPSLRLSAASPAIGKATPLHAESTDFAGRPRDARSGYDIGALQH